MKKLFIASLSMVFLVVFCASAFSATAKDYYDYGKKQLDSGDAKGAIKYFTAAAKLEPRNADYYRAIGDCYKETGNKAMSDKYYAYADKLGKGSASFKSNEAKVEITMFSGGTSSTGTSSFIPVFALGYTKYLNPTFDIGGSVGYAYGGNQTSGMSGDSVSLSGGGVMVQAKCNWHLDNLMKGVFVGPNIGYLPMNYQYKVDMSGFYGSPSTSTSNINITIIMGGMQLGYIYTLDSGFKLTGFLCFDIASESVKSDEGLFGGMAASEVGLIQFYGISAGYGF